MNIKRKLLASAVAAAGLAMAPQASAQIDGGQSLGQIMDVAYSFCPRGWAQANGQILPINTNQALFSLLGTTYGGDGRTTFALPDLRGRSIVNTGTLIGGQTYTWGRKTGLEFVELATSEMPSHTHQGAINTSTGELNSTSPTGAAFAPQPFPVYTRVDPSTATPRYMDPNTVAIGNTGGSLPHENRPPTLAMYRCIALQGIFPSRN